MFGLHTIPRRPGLVKKKRRVGRGYGSARAKTSGRGTKGQGARGNRGSRPGFEGGQSRLLLRLPKKKGFRSPARIIYSLVNVGKLNQLSSGTHVTSLLLFERGWISTQQRPIKILGAGDLSVALHFQGGFSFSDAAREKIEKAGGSILS